MNKSDSSRINGLKGGRPHYSAENRHIFPDFDIVILTPAQYDSLLEKYGYELLRKAISILNKWLQFGGGKYKGKNNYAHFRSDGWLINTARAEINDNKKKKL